MSLKQRNSQQSSDVNLIGELGPEVYLRNLLSVLKGNYPRSTS